MIFFADTEMYKTERTSIKDHTGHLVVGYKKLDTIYYVNIQPIDEKAIKYTWGSDIKSNISMYSDEVLEVEEIVIINNIAYGIEKTIPWNSYKHYALLESDVEVL